MYHSNVMLNISKMLYWVLNIEPSIDVAITAYVEKWREMNS